MFKYDIELSLLNQINRRLIVAVLIVGDVKVLFVNVSES